MSKKLGVFVYQKKEFFISNILWQTFQQIRTKSHRDMETVFAELPIDVSLHQPKCQLVFKTSGNYLLFSENLCNIALKSLYSVVLTSLNPIVLKSQGLF